MRKYILTLIALLLSTNFLLAAQELNPPEIGKRAPELTLEKVLNKPDKVEATLEALNGKIIILEFWATWCQPCIPAMDHLSTLQENFPDHLQVIAISSEDEDRLRKYLEKRPTNAWIGIDSDNSMSRFYGARIIPHSVVIDKEGIITAITFPSEITEGKIKKLLSGESVSFKEKKRYVGGNLSVDTEINQFTLFHVTVKPSQSQSTWSQIHNKGDFKDRRITAGKFTIPMLYQLAYQIPSHNRVIHNFKNPDQYKYENAEKYDFDLIVPQSQKENLYQIMIACLNHSFDLDAKLEKRKIKVKVLKVKSQVKLKVSDGSEDMYTFRGPYFEAKNISIKKFTEYLENHTEVPVVDETMLTGRYDIKMEWQFEDPKTFYQELEKMGLVLEDAERFVEHLVLSD